MAGAVTRAPSRAPVQAPGTRGSGPDMATPPAPRTGGVAPPEIASRGEG